MEVTIRNNKKDYLDFFRSKSIYDFREKYFIVLTLPFFAVVFFTENSFSFERFFVVTSTVALITLIGLYSIPYIIYSSRLNKKITSEKTFLQEKKITITEEGLELKSENEKSILKWGALKQAHSIGKYIFVVLIDRTSIIIPKRFFSSETESLNYLSSIQIQIVNNRKLGKRAIYHWNKNERPPYNLLLLCLVPGVGIVLAIGLIIYAINQRYKKLVLLSFGGLAFSIFLIFLISIIVDVIENIETDLQKTEVSNSQRKLNSLLKEIEFYKIQHGRYPINLEEIVKVTNSPFTVKDPLAEFDQDGNSDYYNYEWKGEQYILFSSGVDRIPNTEDDLYPTIEEKSENKFGLIIEDK